MTAEEASHLIPGGDQVAAITAGDVDGRLEDIPDGRPGVLQGGLQVAQGLAHLRADVARGHDPPLVIERAGARGEDQVILAGPGGVGVRGTRKESGAADEVHGHANGVSHVARHHQWPAGKLVADGYGSTSAGKFREPPDTKLGPRRAYGSEP